MNRRKLLLVAASMPITVVPALSWAAEGTFEITRSEDEWRAMLSDEEYAVMREEATERAGSSPLDGETRAGIFHCRGCDLPLYASSAKYDSGTGWPSFTAALPDAVRTRPDGIVNLRGPARRGPVSSACQATASFATSDQTV